MDALEEKENENVEINLFYKRRKLIIIIICML